MAVVRFELYLESLNQSYVYCVAEMYERNYGRALMLLNASIKDKTFGGNMSRIIGAPLNITVDDWQEYSYFYLGGSMAFDLGFKKNSTSEIITST